MQMCKNVKRDNTPSVAAKIHAAVEDGDIRGLDTGIALGDMKLWGDMLVIKENRRKTWDRVICN